MDEARHLYDQIAKRTAGSIYIGVVGPVRTGKSTFIKRFMEQLVLPNLENTYQRDRARDELPQSGSGRTIMTTEPKFVPEQAVEISPDGTSRLKVRLIDSVGYLVPGAMGAEEEGTPRMVMTPWSQTELPLEQAAEIGTKKVMEEHSSIGIVMTTDGSVTDIPASDYASAQDRAISDMLATGKPFVILVNSEHPESGEAKALARSLSQKYGVGARAVNALTMDEEQIEGILMDLMYEFPATELRFCLPGWVRALPDDGEVKQALYAAMRQAAGKLGKIAQAEDAMKALENLEQVQALSITDVDAGTGTITVELQLPEALFYALLSEKTGLEITGELDLMDILTELSSEQKEYARVKSAMEQVRATGTGSSCRTSRSCIWISPRSSVREAATPCVCAPAHPPFTSCGRILRPSSARSWATSSSRMSSSNTYSESMRATRKSSGRAIFSENRSTISSPTGSIQKSSACRTMRARSLQRRSHA